MKIKVVRLIDARFSKLPNLGEGAELYGGRWNSVGLPLIYCSEHLSLANLEILVGLGKLKITSKFMR